MSDDWFADAADEAAAKADLSKVRAIVVKQEAMKRELERITASAGLASVAARDAAAVFGKVASGAAPALGTGVAPVWGGPPTIPRPNAPRPGSRTKNYDDRVPEGRKPTAAEGLEAILKTIRNADDPRVAASEWLTKATMQITGIVRELDAEDEG